ncbi:MULTISPECIES: hypothetical protein [Citrobacter]|uniref:Uncharacterized protein n=1 Tax=Citrobacter braakii TaxID=57706 RepID=A0ABR6TWH7_CITBR|nr:MULTISPECIES: hypothetical protein [Citrobacter]ELK6838875.1 hypothetical protein [Citrobacter braakii]MBC2610279.1 hypothetical protein [Citrobacter braakii]MBC2634679.1 hypothetical protein [Citrobacter braakii]MBC2647398.1 hypothetical protein [Citrobacter braakii]MBJ9524812.1 hypothetical protein [Citrobacter braakii]
MTTCTAPGHPSCSISCPNGCIAVYYEPNGPCRTMCANGATLDLDSTQNYSIQMSDILATDLVEIFGTSIPLDNSLILQSKNTVSLSLQNVSVEELVKAIHSAL